MSKFKYHYHLLVVVFFVMLYLLTPAQALAVCETGCSCGSISGCPTGDAAIGVNFTYD